MRYKKDSGENYLREYPRLRKWMNTCICCGSMGYKPELLEVRTKKPNNAHDSEFKTFAFDYIRSYYNELAVNENGLCSICARIQNDQ